MNKCEKCEWNDNGTCVCEGNKPCEMESTPNCSSCNYFGKDCGNCEGNDDE